MNATSPQAPAGGDVILSYHYIAAITVLTVCAVLTVWLRMYIRIVVSQNVGWDDWTMFAASVTTYTYAPYCTFLADGLFTACDTAHQLVPDECLSYWIGKAYLLSKIEPNFSNIHVVMGSGAHEPVRRFFGAALNQFVLLAPRTSQENLPISYLEHHRRVSRRRCLHLHQLFFRVQADPEGLGLRNPRKLLSRGRRRCCDLALSR